MLVSNEVKKHGDARSGRKGSVAGTSSTRSAFSRLVTMGALYAALIHGNSALAADLDNSIKNGSEVSSEMSAEQLRQLDATLRPRLWNIPYPSYADTLTQDWGGARSKLAEYGIGLSLVNVDVYQQNLLNTPRSVPSLSGSGLPYPTCTRTSGTVCAGGQAYIGEKPFFLTGFVGMLVYDTSRWGVPDGQIMVQGGFYGSTNDQFNKNGLVTLNALVWYQTLLDKMFELKVGYQAFLMEFGGITLAGNFASTFGNSASVPAEMGMTGNVGMPAAVLKWNITKEFYDQVGVWRSPPVNGQQHGLTGNALLDESLTNPTGLNFTSRVPGASAAVVNEIGYKREASPGANKIWLRAGYIYNASDFQDLSKVATNPDAVIHGASAGYALVDAQLWQFDPSPKTAYKGLYVGASVMGGQNNALPLSQSYEARAYIVGPFTSRPTDLASFVYVHQDVSNHLANAVNLGLPEFQANAPIPAAANFTNSYTLNYLAHIRPGMYGSVGVSYTDNPSVTYFKGQGSAFLVQASLTTIW